MVTQSIRDKVIGIAYIKWIVLLIGFMEKAMKKGRRAVICRLEPQPHHVRTSTIPIAFWQVPSSA